MKPFADVFTGRAAAHASISITEPLVRRLERKNVIERLDVKPRQRVCDFQAGGGYLATGLLEQNPTIEVTCLEPSPSLAKEIKHLGNVVCAPLTCVPIETNYFDRVGCLAGLHHEPNLNEVILEIARIVKLDGIVSIAEVRKGTAEDEWLNGFVNLNNIGGHQGFFPAAGAIEAVLAEHGFIDVRESLERVPWYFQDERQLLHFVREIFGVAQPSDSAILNALDSLFQLQSADGQIVLPWSLAFCSGKKLRHD